MKEDTVLSTMKCAVCGKATQGVELSPGATSAICDDCLAERQGKKKTAAPAAATQERKKSR